MRAPARLRSLVAVVSLLLPGRVDAAGGAYDPLSVANGQPRTLDHPWTSSWRTRAASARSPCASTCPGTGRRRPSSSSATASGARGRGTPTSGSTGRSAATGVGVRRTRPLSRWHAQDLLHPPTLRQLIDQLGQVPDLPGQRIVDLLDTIPADDSGDEMGIGVERSVSEERFKGHLLLDQFPQLPGIKARSMTLCSSSFVLPFFSTFSTYIG